MTPSQQARTQNRSVASSIVHQTYQNVFSYLTTDCPVQTTIGRCIKRVYRDENKTVPWWFQTMLRDAPNHVSGSWHNQSALNVTFNRRDLEFCAIEKVGTKHWRKFFCRLRNEKQDEQRPFCAHVDVAEDSSKAVFLRDPLERYLSGYMDKCLDAKGITEGHCEPTTVFLNKTSRLTEGLTDKKLLFEAYVDAMPLKWNLHFFPQSFYCDGLFRHISSYDFVGIMGTNFYKELGRMGQRYGERVMNSLEDIFHMNQALNETNHGIERSASFHVLDFYTPRSTRRVLEYMAIDYVMFNLPIPEWAEEIIAKDNTIG
jgi:hypothetical protein